MKQKIGLFLTYAAITIAILASIGLAIACACKSNYLLAVSGTAMFVSIAMVIASTDPYFE